MKKILLVLLLSISVYGSSLTEEACLVAGENYSSASSKLISNLEKEDYIKALGNFDSLEKIYLDVTRYCKGKENSLLNSAIVIQHGKIMGIKKSLFE